MILISIRTGISKRWYNIQLIPYLVLFWKMCDIKSPFRFPFLGCMLTNHRILNISRLCHKNIKSVF